MYQCSSLIKNIWNYGVILFWWQFILKYTQTTIGGIVALKYMKKMPITDYQQKFENEAEVIEIGHIEIM